MMPPFHREGQWGRDLMGLGIGKVSALEALSGRFMAAWATSCARGAGPPPSTRVLHPPPCHTTNFPSLVSFHSRLSDRPMKLAHSKRGVALHHRHGLQELDLSGRREAIGGGMEGVASSGLPFYSPSQCHTSGFGPSISHRRIKRPWGPTKRPFNPRNTP